MQSRHPLLLASLGGTLQALSGGRFVLGLGRGGSWLSGPGMRTHLTAATIVDTITILRRLWAGDTVCYRGPAGHYPKLKLVHLPENAGPPPLVMAALGPQSLRLAGRHFDGVLLPAFLTADAVARALTVARDAAADAGRCAQAIRAYVTVVVAADRPSSEEWVIGGRAVTYLQAPTHGERLARLNGWDLQPLQRMRSHPQIAALGGTLADQAYRPQDLIEVSRILPRHWLEEAAAVGSAAHCASRLCDYFRAGADELVLHGSTPELLTPAITAFRQRQTTTVTHAAATPKTRQ